MKDNLLLKQMGANMKAHRKQNNLTLQRLSDLTKIDLSNLWFIENGRRNVHILTLKNIADVLNINIKDLL